MTEIKRVEEPFKFYTKSSLPELTNLRATTLIELAELIKKVPESSIYHHTHNFLRQHQDILQEPLNDFAYWIKYILKEEELGEILASIDTVKFKTIEDLRNIIVNIIEEYLDMNPSSKLKFAENGEGFNFIKSISFIYATNYEAHNINEFKEILMKVTSDSIYFHMFEARLRLNKKTNDFSLWFEKYLEDKELSDKISMLDPYSYTLEELRHTLIYMINKRILSYAQN